MHTLTEPFHRHHKLCDDLFADTEAVVGSGDWSKGQMALDSFCAELEKHFRTEEEALFPAFEKATGMVGGPTQMMRHEHAQMRGLIEQMAATLDARDSAAFAGAAETLLILMQQHNMKEENILYPMCDRNLASQQGELGPLLSQSLQAAIRVSA